VARFRRAVRPAHSLLHRANGTAAREVRDELGVSKDATIADLTARLERLERELAYAHRHFRGFRIGESRSEVVPDAEGWVDVYSLGETIGLTRDPNRKVNGWNIEASGACDCCPEDIDFQFNNTGCPCITIELHSIVGCTYNFNVNLDCDCVGLGGNGG
jgi:hypothetical protein